MYETQLAGVTSLDDLRAAQLDLDLDSLVPRDARARYLALPGTVVVRDREVEIDYDVEERDGQRAGVARLRLPEKLARTLSADELPTLDRDLRFIVTRGQRGSVRADSLDQLQELLARPWTDEEVERHERSRQEHVQKKRDDHRGRRTRNAAGEFRRGSRGPGRGSGDDPRGGRPGGHGPGPGAAGSRGRKGRKRSR